MATPEGEQRVAILVDGGFWFKKQRAVVKKGTVAELFADHVRKIEGATKGKVVHVTIIDSDPAEYVAEAVNEGLTNEGQMNALGRMQDDKVEAYAGMKQLLGLKKLDVTFCGYKVQITRTMLPPHSKNDSGCTFAYITGMAQRGVDVAFAVRALEYAAGTYTPPLSKTPLKNLTSLVLITGDSDMEPAFESLVTNYEHLKLYLCGKSRQLEAYVPSDARITLFPEMDKFAAADIDSRYHRTAQRRAQIARASEDEMWLTWGDVHYNTTAMRQEHYSDYKQSTQQQQQQQSKVEEVVQEPPTKKRKVPTDGLKERLDFLRDVEGDT